MVELSKEAKAEASFNSDADMIEATRMMKIVTKEQGIIM